MNPTTGLNGAILQASKVEVRRVDFNSEFISRMIPRLEWPVVKQAAVVVCAN